MVNARYDVLVWNRMATHFIGDLSVHAVEDRNLIRWTFANGADSPVWRDEGARRFTRATVAPTCGPRMAATRVTRASRRW